MKILLAGQAFYQHNNGQAVFTINLAEGLAEAGHTAMVLAPSETGQAYQRQQQGVTVQTVPALHQKYSPLPHNQAQWASIGAASLAKVATHTRQNTIQQYLAWYRLLRRVEDDVRPSRLLAFPSWLPQPQVIPIPTHAQDRWQHKTTSLMPSQHKHERIAQ